MKRLLSPWLVVALLVAMLEPAAAWGPEGHRIVVELAQHQGGGD